MELALQAIPLDRVGAAVFGGPYLLQLRLDRPGPPSEPGAEGGGLPLELVLGQAGKPLLMPVDEVDDRLDALAVAVEAGAEDRGHEGFDHAGSKYNPCREIYPSTASGTQYRIGRPSRTRRRISVAEISIAGTSMTPAMSGDAGTAEPGRANTMTRAASGISRARCQASSSAAASAPSRRVNWRPGSRSRSWCRVSIV